MVICDYFMAIGFTVYELCKDAEEGETGGAGDTIRTEVLVTPYIFLILVPPLCC
jgi:hypothetical protein